MFIITLTYKKSLAEVDKYLTEHREFLEAGYKNNFFIASGPKNPRTGGIIISQLTHREDLENIIKQDPFYLNHIADYEIVEFTPVKYHKEFSYFIS